MVVDLDSRKSTFGYLITFFRGAVSWRSKLHMCVALSTTEACKEMLRMKRFLQELVQEKYKYTVYCDSQSAIHLSKNSSFHSKLKHIDLRYHYIHDMLESQQQQVEKIHTEDNLSDMMTKSLL